MKQLMMMQDELKKVQEKSLQPPTLPQSIPSQVVSPSPLIPGQQSPLTRGGGNFMPPIYNGPSLSKKPNIISGIVEGKDGNLVPGVIVIVKDDKSRPVRAMKTNSLGQFITTTALENGVYTIELSKSGFSFGRYEVELTGMPLPTYEFASQ